MDLFVFLVSQVCLKTCDMLWASVILALVSTTRGSLRVYAGVKDTQGNFPFAVNLYLHYRNKTNKWCTASAITNLFILTAAHCNANTKILYVNKNAIGKDRRLVRASKVILNPGYKEYDAADIGVLRHDIAFILMTSPIIVEKYADLSSVDYKSLIGLPVLYAGFGKTYKDDYDDDEEVKDNRRSLLMGDGVVSTCDLNDRYWGPVICVQPKCSLKEQSTLSGDSGCPLTFRGKIIGVLNGGDDEYSNLFAPISVYLDWIRDTIVEKKI